MFKWYFNSCPLLPVLLLSASKKALSSSSLLLPALPESGIYTYEYDHSFPTPQAFFSLDSLKPLISVSFSNSLIIFKSLHWTCSSVSTSFQYWADQTWTQHSRLSILLTSAK